ncbi:MAG TPA: helix-hairpin-helix domain-containing protein [bacterium]|uniref:ComE operon protein 1 n=1 Tax=candidate division TA06 bacterium ADurb.Bin417 TaxID=1852828 RepID=A0A1V5M7P5_UNCT6|nr:MAG: ComE operon protein 1 [candidate division TA06 bacterium ADurb.Bin417]HNQ36112.1 helix-hairpin-helix domain-containing protein [bacterium]HNS49503.1 helix-hairpin-helix domain-containing protein [bacterium]
MDFLTARERLGVILITGSLLVGQAVLTFQNRNGVHYRYLESDARRLAELENRQRGTARVRMLERDLQARIDPNTATAEELETLPGIGPALSRRIITHRSRRPFRTLDELKEVPGIGPAKLGALKARLEIRTPGTKADR